jgi:small multidrug resistance family-3 protein
MVMVEGRYELDPRCYWWFYLISVWNSPDISASYFHRIYAAYGGIFIVMALLWGFTSEGIVPDIFDVIGAVVACTGVAIIHYAPRGEEEKLWSNH